VKPNVPWSDCPHRCINCGERVHGQECGYPVDPDYCDVGRYVPVNPLRLSAEGQADFGRRGAIVCNNCYDTTHRYESGYEITWGSAPDAADNEFDAAEVPDDVAATEPDAAPAVVDYSSFTLDHVEYSTSCIHPIVPPPKKSKGKSPTPEQLTCFKGFGGALHFTPPSRHLLTQFASLLAN
jgi:hypothetical protein